MRLYDRVSSPEQATQDIATKVISITANNFLMERMLPSLLNEADEQGKGNYATHEQYPKAIDNR